MLLTFLKATNKAIPWRLKHHLLHHLLWYQLHPTAQIDLA